MPPPWKIGRSPPVTVRESVLAGRSPPVTVREYLLAGRSPPVTVREYLLAGRSPPVTLRSRLCKKKHRKNTWFCKVTIPLHLPCCAHEAGSGLCFIRTFLMPPTCRRNLALVQSPLCSGNLPSEFGAKAPSSVFSLRPRFRLPLLLAKRPTEPRQAPSEHTVAETYLSLRSAG